jgi:hypothetical protein
LTSRWFHLNIRAIVHEIGEERRTTTASSDTVQREYSIGGEMTTDSTPPKSAQTTAGNISPKSRLATTILAWVLGGLGVDRFYTGHIVLGILKLITGGGLGIWWIIDFVMAVAGKRKDKQGGLIEKW